MSEADFTRASVWVSSSSTPTSTETKLRLYALFKIATSAPLPPSRPSLFDFTARAKYDAWAKLLGEGQDSKQAREAYVAEAKQLGWPGGEVLVSKDDDSVEEDEAHLKKETLKGMVSVSVMKKEEPLTPGASSPLHDAAVDGDVKRLVELMADPACQANGRDSFGYTPLHLAADRGHVDVVKALLAAGADHSLQDEDEQTPLDLAIECGHEEIVTILRER